MIRAVSVYSVVNWHKPWSFNRADKPKTIWSYGMDLNKQDTFIVIFGPHQEEERKMFEKYSKYKILFKSATAVNRMHKDELPVNRNTLYVFEINE